MPYRGPDGASVVHNDTPRAKSELSSAQDRVPVTARRQPGRPSVAILARSRCLAGSTYGGHRDVDGAGAGRHGSRDLR